MSAENETQHVVLTHGGAIIHLVRCESCMFGHHFDEVTPHDWAGPEDIEHAEATGQESPAGQRCNCWCAGDLEPAPQEEP